VASLLTLKNMTDPPILDAFNICKVTADLSDVPESKFMRSRAGLNSEEYLMAEIKLEATWAGDRVTWNFIFDGKSYASMSVSYTVD
jgi:hypothetical protein